MKDELVRTKLLLGAQALEKLKGLAEELADDNITRIVQGVDFDSEDHGQVVIEQALSYISENYRIERNVIRNRREYVSEVLGQRKLHGISYSMKNTEDDYSERNVYYSLLEYISSKIEEESIETEFNFDTSEAIMKGVPMSMKRM